MSCGTRRCVGGRVFRDVSVEHKERL